MSRMKLIVSLAVAVGILAPVRTMRAQSADNVLDAKSAAFIRQQYLNDMDTVHVKILALAHAIPADKYSWRPSAGVRSVSEVLMHIAGEWYWYGPKSVAGEAPANFLKADEKAGAKLEGLEKTITSKDAVIAELTKSWTHCKAQIAGADASKLTGRYKPWGVTLVEATLGMTGDQHEHLGQLIAYARANNIKPPWSK